MMHLTFMKILIDVPKTDSDTLTTLIKDCLLCFSLPLSQCRGQAYDSTFNMSGHISGVAAQIQEIEPTAICDRIWEKG